MMKTRVLELPFSSSSDSESETEDPTVMAEEEEPPPTWNDVTANNSSVNNNNNNNGMSISSIDRKRLLSKQLSMRETSREAKWEKRRRQILHRRRMMLMSEAERGCGPNVGVCLDQEEDQELDEIGRGRRNMNNINAGGRVRSLTDEDLDELRGSIELGFGFDEENGGHNLCDTLPALDLYFAVNRQLSDPKIRLSPSPVSTPTATSSSSTLCCGTPSPRSPNEQHSGDSWKICNPGDNPQHVKTRLRHWAQVVACSVRQAVR